MDTLGVIRNVFGATLLLFAASAATAAEPVKVEVLHWMGGAGKVPALKLMAEAFKAENIEWVDNLVPDPGKQRSLAVNRMLAGDAPGIVQFNAGSQMVELVKQGLLRNMDAVASADNWKDQFTPDLMGAISFEGHVYGAPLFATTPVFMWYNKALFAKLGISDPVTWDDFFAAVDKLKAAGVLPLVGSKEGFTRGHLFQLVLTSVGGRDLYLKYYRERDRAAVQGPEFLEVAKVLGKIRDATDPDYQGRTWDQAIGMVAKGTAGMMFLNEGYGKAELAAANLTAGKDYGCAILTKANRRPVYIQDVQVFLAPKTGKADVDAAQDKIAKLLASADLQTKVAAAWQGTPANLKVDVSALDACSQVSVKAMQDGANSVPTSAWVGMGPDLRDTLADVIYEYWGDPSMAPEEFARKLSDVFTQFAK